MQPFRTPIRFFDARKSLVVRVPGAEDRRCCVDCIEITGYLLSIVLVEHVKRFLGKRICFRAQARGVLVVVIVDDGSIGIRFGHRSAFEIVVPFSHVTGRVCECGKRTAVAPGIDSLATKWICLIGVPLQLL